MFLFIKFDPTAELAFGLKEIELNCPLSKLSDLLNSFEMLPFSDIDAVDLELSNVSRLLSRLYYCLNSIFLSNVVRLSNT